ncbi:phosphotransferase family protein [Nocardia sp. NPDC004068]|uniref:phosphotransferase family protein n=1 Tax=Nocardia sp. NPDC004068 TaxID=3364303 RepID=UPI00368B57A6
MATQLSPRQFDELREVVVDACAQVGLNGHGAELIQYTVNATVRLRDAPVVVRVSAGEVGRARGARVVDAARWLVTRGAPIVEPWACDQPIHVGDYTVTFWHELATKKQWTAEELVAPLKALHALEPVDTLANWDPFTIARQRLAAADPVVSDEDLAWLSKQWSEAEQQYRATESTMPIGVVHGDPHTGNLLLDERTGRAVLCDLDETGIGPIAWDLVPQAVGAERFARQDFYRKFVAAYGSDVRNEPYWPVLQRIRELIMVTSVLPGLGHRPEVAAQHAHRLASLRQGHRHALWARYQ